MSLSELFCVEDVIREAQTIKTHCGDIWINLADGRFVLRRSLGGPCRHRLKSAQNLYPFIDCVMKERQLIAKRYRNQKYLRRLEKPIVIKNII